MAARSCVGCGTGLGGRAQKWCDACRPDRANRRRLAKIAAANGDHERAASILKQRPPSSSAPTTDLEEWASLRLAGALGLTSDLEHARKIAGLPKMPRADLRKLQARAEKEWPDVIALRTEGFQKVGFAAVMQSWIALLPQLHELPANQIAPAAKAVMDGLEKMQTGLAPTYGAFVLNMTVVRRESRS